MYQKRFFILMMLVFVLSAAAFDAGAASVVLKFSESKRELVNPYIGNAAWANDDSEREQPFTLVYANLLWAELEPEEGEYDFRAFEESHHFEKWRAEGKHLVLRFVMDRPGRKSHRDIPDWLWRKTGKDGETYENSYGRGYSPNYENPLLIEAHAKAIRALSGRYGQDPFLAYLELGSLGHWGEWHVHSSLRSLPLASTRDLYVVPYLDAFPLAKLMMRRPFAVAEKYNMGLYNDTSGALESTETWLRWIETGGTYNQTGETNVKVSMADAWKKAPIGGELATSDEKSDYLEDGMLQQTLRLFERSHTSWVGPRSFVNVERGGEYQPAVDQVNRLIGYRLRVAEAEIKQKDDSSVIFRLSWANSGIAPFYFGWVPSLRMMGVDGNVIVLPLEMNLQDVLPGRTVQVELNLENERLPDGGYTVYVGIINPASGYAEVELAMDTPREGNWFELFQIKENRD